MALFGCADSRSVSVSPSIPVENIGRLGANHRPGCNRSSHLPSRGREAVSDSLAVDGADPPLRQSRSDGCRSRVSDRVIANRLVYRFHAPERGDIIVFNAPARVEAACNASGTFVKRIVGLPGEQVSMQDGHVLINGVRLREPYLAPAYRGRESGEWPRSPRGGYFVLGDNRAMSCDSRRWGVVPRESIIGRADIRYWPPNRAGEP